MLGKRIAWLSFTIALLASNAHAAKEPALLPCAASVAEFSPEHFAGASESAQNFWKLRPAEERPQPGHFVPLILRPRARPYERERTRYAEFEHKEVNRNPTGILQYDGTGPQYDPRDVVSDPKIFETPAGHILKTGTGLRAQRLPSMRSLFDLNNVGKMSEYQQLEVRYKYLDSRTGKVYPMEPHEVPWDLTIEGPATKSLLSPLKLPTLPDVPVYRAIAGVMMRHRPDEPLPWPWGNTERQLAWLAVFEHPRHLDAVVIAPFEKRVRHPVKRLLNGTYGANFHQGQIVHEQIIDEHLVGAGESQLITDVFSRGYDAETGRPRGPRRELIDWGPSNFDEFKSQYDKGLARRNELLKDQQRFTDGVSGFETYRPLMDTPEARRYRVYPEQVRQNGSILRAEGPEYLPHQIHETKILGIPVQIDVDWLLFSSGDYLDRYGAYAAYRINNWRSHEFYGPHRIRPSLERAIQAYLKGFNSPRKGMLRPYDTPNRGNLINLLGDIPDRYGLLGAGRTHVPRYRDGKPLEYLSGLFSLIHGADQDHLEVFEGKQYFRHVFGLVMYRGFGPMGPTLMLHDNLQRSLKPRPAPAVVPDAPGP